VNSARLFIYRFRRPLAAASAGLAVLLLAAALRPASADLVDVVVAAADLPPGATLSAQDLSVASLPSDYLPPGAVMTADDVVGRTIAGAVSAGEPLTQSRLIATGPRADGLHTVPVRLADAEAATLLTPGSVIDLVLASRDTTPRVIAEGVQVVTIPQRPASTGLGGTSRAAGSLIVVATDRRTAVALAAAGTQPGLGVVLR
jgi:Flp pilus assembly protein CpaB